MRRLLLAIAFLVVLCAIGAEAQIICVGPNCPSSGGGAAGSITSGTTAIVGGGDTQVCFNDAAFISCGDTGFTFNKTSNVATLLGGVTLGASAANTGVLTLFHASHAFSSSFTVSATQASGAAYILPVDDGTAGEVLQTNGAGLLDWVAAGIGDALVANPLSQFAATTSAQFASVISNETGTGLVVLNDAPSFATSIRTPLALIGTASTTRGFADFFGATHAFKSRIQISESQGADVTYTLPTTDGGASEFLQTDGAGVLTWAAAGGGITVGTTTITSGTSTRVPFNDAGVYGEDAGLTYDKTNDYLSVTNRYNISGNSPTTGIYATLTGSAILLANTGTITLRPAGAGSIVFVSDGTTSGGQVSIGSNMAGTAVPLTVNNNTSTGNIVSFQDNGTLKVSIRDSGQLVFSTTVPAVSDTSANSCGTTAATIAGTMETGIITVGATAGTSCTVTFGTAAPTRRQCVVNNETSANLARATASSTTVSIFAGTFGGGDVLAYQCSVY